MRLPKRKKKDPEVVGIHVGRSSITIVRVVRFPETVQVTRVFREVLNREAAQWPAEAIDQKLDLAKRAVDLRAEEVTVTLSSDLAPSYFLSLPALADEHLAEAIELQIKNNWGESCPDLSWEYSILEKQGGRCRVFGVGIPSEMVRGILGSFRGANCAVDSMEVDSVSMVNLLAYCRLLGATPNAVLDIGPASAYIHIVNKGRIDLSREIVLQDPSSSSVAASAVLVTDDSGELRLTPAYVQRVTTEVNKTLDHFEIEMLSQPVERLILIGEGTKDNSLTDVLGQELGLSVGVLETGDRISDATGRFDPALHGPAVAAAVGDRAA